MDTELKHASDSSEQREIERIIIEELQKTYHFKFQDGILKLDNTSFQIDFYNLEEGILGEIYSGLESLKPGQKKKLATDVLKMITIEKLIGKSFKKLIIVVDQDIANQINTDSWLSKTIQLYEIEVIKFDLNLNLLEKLTLAKQRQGEKFKNP